MRNPNYQRGIVGGKNVIVGAYTDGANWYVSTETFDDGWNTENYEFTVFQSKGQAIADTVRRGLGIPDLVDNRPNQRT